MSQAQHNVVLIHETRIENQRYPAGTVIGTIDADGNRKSAHPAKDMPEAMGRGVIERCLNDETAEIQAPKGKGQSKGKGQEQTDQANQQTSA